jgi:hypothetical protein
MKTLGKLLGSILVLLILLLLMFRLTGLPPAGGWPGLWLRGGVVTDPVNDWSFTDQYPVIQVQTKSWYGLPHSVNTHCVAYNGQLYWGSSHPASQPYPGRRIWDRNVARDPHVRLKIGGKIHERVLVHGVDPAEHYAVVQAEMKEYPNYRYPKGSEVNIFHVTDG